MTCVPLLVETFGGLSPALMHELRAAAEWRSNKLTSSESTLQLVHALAL